MRENCIDILTNHEDLLVEVMAGYRYGIEQAGYGFLLTRNHHDANHHDAGFFGIEVWE